MTDVLATIWAARRRTVERAKATRPVAVLERDAAAAPPPRDFVGALRSARGYGLIAEIKKASPSAGLIRPDFDPAALARAYREGGATCLSVLTERDHFSGGPEHLQAARSACELPIIRKDFMLDPYQIVEARAMGADCILLILAGLSDELARELAGVAKQCGLAVLPEVHDTEELQRALRLETRLVGINNRNLKTLKTDLATTERLVGAVPADRLVVSESGLATPADLARMARAGVRHFLIGESLLRQPDVAAATRLLVQSAGAGASA